MLSCIQLKEPLNVTSTQCKNYHFETECKGEKSHIGAYEPTFFSLLNAHIVFKNARCRKHASLISAIYCTAGYHHYYQKRQI